MKAPNVKSISIELWKRISTKDYAVSLVVRPLRGGVKTATTHILEPKLLELIALMDIDVPPHPDPENNGEKT